MSEENSQAAANRRKFEARSVWGKGRPPACFDVDIPEDHCEAIIDRIEYAMQVGLLPINLQFLTRILAVCFPEVYGRELPTPHEAIDASPFGPEIVEHWAERAKDRRCLWSPSDKYVPLHELAKSFSGRVAG